jgi:hypothetical protein
MCAVPNMAVFCSIIIIIINKDRALALARFAAIQ